MDADKKKAKTLSVSVRIGKKGLNEEVLKEIKIQLKANKIIKIKFLKNFDKRDNLAEVIDKILSETNSNIILKSGFVIVIKKIAKNELKR